MNKNMLISIIIVAIAIIATSYFFNRHEHENSLNEFGHEIGHADMRHSTRQMTQMFGIQLLLDVLAGNRAALKQVTGALIGLKFSRAHETEADERSVTYLCPTSYNADGGAGFFEKIQASGGARVPAFLSTHPDPGNRVEKFKEAKLENGCLGNETFATEYKRIISKLP
jgi:predicted Zn-dependent protease